MTRTFELQFDSFTKCINKVIIRHANKKFSIFLFRVMADGLENRSSIA